MSADVLFVVVSSEAPSSEAPFLRYLHNYLNTAVDTMQREGEIPFRQHFYCICRDRSSQIWRLPNICSYQF